jgi:hypothetical protein
MTPERRNSGYETSIAGQRFCKQVSAATDMQATIEEMLRTMFSVRSVRSSYKKSSVYLHRDQLSDSKPCDRSSD